MVSTKERKLIKETECQHRKGDATMGAKWVLAAITIIILQAATAFMLVISVFNQGVIRDRIDMLHVNGEMEVVLCVIAKPVEERTVDTLRKCKEQVMHDDS